MEDVLFFFFGILALYKLIKAKSVGSIVLVSFLIFLSILSKETGALFLPLALLILTGGAGRRFSEIAIHTDPTLPTQTDFLRQADLGKNLVVGSSPSMASNIRSK